APVRSVRSPGLRTGGPRPIHPCPFPLRLLRQPDHLFRRGRRLRRCRARESGPDHRAVPRPAGRAVKSADSPLTPDLFRKLYRIRRVEEEIARIYPTDKIKSPVHLSIGQEAISVAVCESLRADDVIFLSYRSHAGYLAKGGDLRAMIAEL